MKKCLCWFVLAVGLLMGCADPVLENPYDPGAPNYAFRTPRCLPIEVGPLPTFLTPSDPLVLTSATDGATILYSLDGTAPEASGLTAPATGIVLPSGTVTVRAVATKPGWDNSSEFSGSFAVLSLVQSWEFDASLDGWMKPGDNLQITSWAWNPAGTAAGTIVGTDPRVWSPSALTLPLGTVKLVELRLKNSSPGVQGSLYWKTATQTWSAALRLDFPVAANSDFTVYRLNLSGRFGANDTLAQWRLDPENNEKSGSFDLDYFRVYALAP